MEKVKYEIEFDVHASPSMLFNYIHNPSALGEWFADNVNARTELYTFMWDGSEENATLLKSRQDKYVKFQWENDNDTEYFFRIDIQVDEITKDVSLIVTDFAEEDELEEAKMLWDSQINELKHVLGIV